jgi:D-alanyl-D-alanine carboxypeptidase
VKQWIEPAVAYAERWIGYQMEQHQQPGCVISVAGHDGYSFDRAFGVSDIRSGDPMTTGHRFRVASHSKTFTAVGIMKLYEAGKLHLDQPVGRYVDGLHPSIAETTVSQVLSHSSGMMRDGRLSPHWQVKAPFFDEKALFEELRQPASIEANTRFKYSNLGYALLGCLIEEVTGEIYSDWIDREVIAPSGLRDTTPDMTPELAGTLSAGHSGRMPSGRGIIDGSQPTHALSPATGFVSTARDLARFFASLDPEAKDSVLSVMSRREIARRQWQVPYKPGSRHYGLGALLMETVGHSHLGHTGAFPGYLTRTALVTDWGLAISVATNAIDGPAGLWLEGIVSIFDHFSLHGVPDPEVSDWDSRWWTIWAAIDLVPMGAKVFVSDPAAARPFAEETELRIVSRSEGTIAFASGFGNHGEPVRRTFDDLGNAESLLLGGNRWSIDPSDLAIDYGRTSDELSPADSPLM